MDKTIRKITDPKQQQAETYRYWQSLPVGDRLVAVWEASVDAYGFKGVRLDDEQRSERTLTRVQRRTRDIADVEALRNAALESPKQEQKRSD